MSPVVVILAGGRATRMGGQDKALLPFGAGTLLDQVLARMAPQGTCVISANGDPARFARFGRPVLGDGVPGYPGPLAGVLAGMEWARGRAEDVVTVPVDGPFVPRDLVARLVAARDAAGAQIACAVSGERVHPVYALWPASLAPVLRDALIGGERRVGLWAARFRLVRVAFSAAPVDAFFNVNGPSDLVSAEMMGSAALTHPTGLQVP